jgi:hypothetical protein
MRPRIVLAFRADTPVAGAVVAVCGDTAYYCSARRTTPRSR